MSFTLAVAIAVCMTVLEVNNKTVPTVFPVTFTALAGVGGAIAASGGGSSGSSGQSTTGN